jgi:hypothetical protein
MIQIRHVPEDVHRTLTARARRAGMSLSDHLLQEVTVLSRQMSWEELFDEIDEQEPTATGALRARLQADPDIHVPHLVDAEVTNALRHQLLAGQLDILRARRAIRRLTVMRPVRWQQTPLLGRALASAIS